MSKTIHGTIYGKTIQLDEESGLADGEEVEVIVKPAKPQQPWGEGLKRCAGALADSWKEEDDRILEQIYQERKSDSRPEGRLNG